MARERGARTFDSDDLLFDIVEYLRDTHTAGVSEIAESVDAAKSTVHGHLRTLQRRGYVASEDGIYRIGLEFLHLGKHAQHSKDVFQMAKEKVDRLAEQTGELAECIIEENGLGFPLYRSGGEQTIRSPDPVGAGIPLHQLAAGKCILANLPAERVEEILDRHGLASRTPNTITSESELQEELDTVREQGYAFNKGESLPITIAISAPILTQNQVYGALSITGPEKRINEPSYQQEIIDLLTGATNELAVNLEWA